MKTYARIVLNCPLAVLAVILLLSLCLAAFIPDFRLDASADTLVKEGDEDLAFSRVVNERFAARDFVFVIYTPHAELFSAPVLATLETLRNELAALEHVESVDSLLDMPLFEVSGMGLAELDPEGLLTLQSPDVDLQEARADLLGNAAYRDVLVSTDGATAGLIVNFAPGEDSQEALHGELETIRGILERYRQDADIAMGGVPMIADDLIAFVRSDLLSFGSAILLFIVLSLSLLFRKLRYVAVPLLCCAVTGVMAIGLLGLLDWRVTVISSNFISLLLIITISLTVHLIVRYRELEQAAPEQTHRERLSRTLGDMALPCFYTSLTTLVAFFSLVVSDIPPIADFGWMMVMGICLAFTLTFLLFPAALALLRENRSRPPRHRLELTPALARLTLRHGTAVLVVSALLLVLSVAGMTRLRVENSFINYFDEDTEIYRGMVSIDQRMGGTTPLDVIVNLRPGGAGGQAAAGQGGGAVPQSDSGFGDSENFDEFGFGSEGSFDESGFGAEESVDEFGFGTGEGYDEFGFGSEEQPDEADAYWFTSAKMRLAMEMHTWLEALPETGKVLSLATLLSIAYDLNEGEALSDLELAVLYRRIPEDYKQSLLRPYVSVEEDQLRYSIRIHETDPGLQRAELLSRIESGLKENFGLEDGQVRLTGMLVLYTNMLRSLFESQILTLALVLGIIMLMFMLLFRSLKLALIGIVPNVIAAGSVLGLMGWLNIPLDMMTITIAAISVGIGVDNTIHYVHRFKTAFPRLGHDYEATLQYCHDSIARAMYYTGFTIVAGFSILVLSNFTPTITFGLLTSLAMILALFGALTLLPAMLLRFRPLPGPEAP